MDIPQLILGLVVLIFSVIFHEIMHGWVALKMGDTTARDEGRLTLNPIPHIDPWMTILFPIMTLIASNGAFPFGGAKPVRINPSNFRNPNLGMMISAAAGPLSNFFLAIVSFGLLFVFYKIAPTLLYDSESRELSYNGLFFGFMIFTNILLGAFNLIPIPPLDGSRILRYFLPERGRFFVDRMEPFGLLIVLSLVFLRLHVVFLLPFYSLMGMALNAAFDPNFFEIFVRGLKGT
jgi:Zn-dependent protease